MSETLISIADLYQLWGAHWCLRKEDFQVSRIQQHIPIHHHRELLGDFYALLTYQVKNSLGIKSLVLMPEGAFFSTCSTKDLIQERMSQRVLDASGDRQLRDFLCVPSNRELSSCFGDSVMMHLSGVSSSHCADWIALHHIADIVPSNNQGERYFIYCNQMILCLPVQENFNRRLLDVTMMSTCTILALNCLGQQLNLKVTVERSHYNILQQADYQYQFLQRRINTAELIRFRQSWEDNLVAKVLAHPELAESVAVFDDCPAFFRSYLQRQHNLN